VSGDTSAGGLARLDWVLRNDPEVVIVALGAAATSSTGENFDWTTGTRRGSSR
jgi:lysophospholipase L1-like esterase